MTRAEILEAVHRLPLGERLALVDAILHQVRADVANLEEPQAETRREQRMAAAAELMREEYATNSELTAFTALDGEDFLE